MNSERSVYEFRPHQKPRATSLGSPRLSYVFPIRALGGGKPIKAAQNS